MVARFALLVSCVFMMWGARAGEKTDWKNAQPEVILKAVRVFEENPAGPDAAGPLAVVINYAEASDSVAVTISEPLFPWMMAADEPQEVKSALLGAYIAGNTRAQLEKKVCGNQPFEGVKLMLSAYSKMLAGKKVKNIADLDRMLNLSDDELRKDVESRCK